MYYVALCDDNEFDLKILTDYLGELRKAHLLIEDITFKNGYDLVKLYKSGRRFHLIILDMVMEPIDGIETAKLIRQYDSDVPILIVTSTPEYAMEGYKVNASRYILKPVEKNLFLSEIKRILSRCNQNKSRYFSFSSESGITKVDIGDICFFESDIRTITMKTKTNSFSFTGKLKDVENQMSTYGFVRVHKSYVVNLKYVQNIFKDTITMENGNRVLLSKYKRKDIQQQLLNYMESSL